jgi:hypothetical protein
MISDLRAAIVAAAIGGMAMLSFAWISSNGVHAATRNADAEVAGATAAALDFETAMAAQAGATAAIEGAGPCVGDYALRPEGTHCVRLDSSPDSVLNGLAYFGVGIAGDGGHADIVGRGPDGVWHVWFGSQQHSTDSVTLPRELRVCAGGDTLNVRAEPTTSSAIVAVLQDQALVYADRFVFTNPSTNVAMRGSVIGAGWFQLSDRDGWVLS